MSGNSEITFDRLMKVAFVEWCVCESVFVFVSDRGIGAEIGKINWKPE